jgi:hypothetical protein
MADELRGDAARAWTSGGVVSALPTGLAGGDAGPGTTFSDGGGLVLTAVQVQLVFWGSAWNQAASPSANQVVTAVQTILGSPYMLGLSQYRGIGRGTLAGSAVISTSSPPSPFTDADVVSFLMAQISSGPLPPAAGNPSCSTSSSRRRECPPAAPSSVSTATSSRAASTCTTRG